MPDRALPSVIWWRGFGSKEFTALIEEAMTSNLDIAAAVARIIQADANRTSPARRRCRLSISMAAPAAAGLPEHGGGAAPAGSRGRPWGVL